VREYVYPVGRLDYDSEGLLLLTNDGDLAARLTHPRHEVERTYEAYVAGTPDKEAIDQLRRGIPLDGRQTMPADVALLSRPAPGSPKPPAPRKGVPVSRVKGSSRETRNSDKRANGVLLITIREGRNRQVRRMCEAVGHPVRRLRRIRIGPITDRRLRVGEWRELTRPEVEKLKASLSLAPRARPLPQAAARPRPASAR
jgi:23S rRNA pseudouridine2605 synthase